MAVIEIREQEKTETGFEATLIIEGNSYPITVSDPFDTEQEEELEWYFEDWMDYPMLDNIKADRAKASVREYGKELFRQVFKSNSEAYANYSDLKHQAKTIHNLATIFEQSRQFFQAQIRYKEALDLFIQLEDTLPQAGIYYQLGMIEEEFGNYYQSQHYYTKALDIFIKYNDRHFIYNTYNQLGSVTEKLGQLNQAQNYYKKSLNFSKNNDSYQKARIYHNLGMVAENQAKFKQAQNYYQQALEIFIQYKDQSSQGKTYYKLGKVYKKTKDYHKSKQYFQKALDIYIKRGTKSSLGITYFQLGLLSNELLEFDLAKKCFGLAKVNSLNALKIFFDDGDDPFLYVILKDLGNLYRQTQDYSLIKEISMIMKITEEEARQQFNKLIMDN